MMISDDLALCAVCIEANVGGLDYEAWAAEGMVALEAYLAPRLEFARWLVAHHR